MRLLLPAFLATAALLAGSVGDSAATTACHPNTTTPILRGNLDRDASREVITATNVTCSHEYAYSIDDRCLNVTNHHWLSGQGIQRERKLANVNGNARDGREFFYVFRRERPDDIGSAHLVHLVLMAPNRCPRPRYLFRYESSEPLLPPPRAAELTEFNVAPVQLSSRYKGLEIRLAETFKRGNERFTRTMLLRYSPRADRYVVYRPQL
jgi:hypothetical protein